MAETVSPAAGRRYGVARVCRAWDVPRSSFYAARTAATRPPAAPARRGPKPAISDADLLAAIRADLARSPWSGEALEYALQLAQSQDLELCVLHVDHL